MIYSEKQVAFISYPRLTQTVLEFIPDLFDKVDVYDADVSEVLAIARKLIYSRSVEVIISAGGNGEYLRTHIDEIPVIVFNITVADILEGIKSLSKASKKVGILGYRNVIPDITKYEEYISFDFCQGWYTDSQDMERLLVAMIKDGCDGFIGGGLVCDCAIKYGYPAYIVYSKENIEKAFKEAFKYQYALYFNREKEERINTILNYSKRAFLFINTDKQIVNVNPSAESILGIHKNQLIGKQIDSIINIKEIDALIMGQLNVKESLTVYKGKPLTITWMPFKSDGQVTDIMAILDNKQNNYSIRENGKNSLNDGYVSKYTFDDILGHSKSITNTIETAIKYAETDFTILIRGETGTGKELFAQAIHNHSLRSNKPFVSVNCSSIPKSLLESELFGYESGTFTGGRKDGKLGLIEQANTGTLFLDEIGDISIEAQIMLLRVLQEKQLRRLGSNKIIPIDVRIIAATNQHLEELINKGLFRLDLYYRLNVLSLDIPPLRDRKEDIPEIIKKGFINKHGIDIKDSTIDILIDKLMRVDYKWPGNIRELENIFIRAINSIGIKDTIEGIINDLSNNQNIYLNNTSTNMQERACEDISDERDRILKALEEARWNKSKAANTLGMSRTTLWRKMNDLNIYV
jgi:propionate catabolism operon transcriptional regulator